jgi:hypothetical protein
VFFGVVMFPGRRDERIRRDQLLLLFWGRGDMIIGNTQFGPRLDKTHFGQHTYRTHFGQHLDRTHFGQGVERTHPGQCEDIPTLNSIYTEHTFEQHICVHVA